MITLGNTNAAAHTEVLVDVIDAVAHTQGVELAEHETFFAARTEVFVHRGRVSGRGKHRRAMAMGLHRPAAAIAAIADGIKSSEHRVFEKRVMHMASGVLLLKDFNGLCCGDTPGPRTMMLENKSCKGFTDDQADIEGKARRWPGRSAWAFQNGDMIGIGQDDVLRQPVGDHALQILQLDGLVHRQELCRCLERDHLSVVGVCKEDARLLTVAAAVVVRPTETTLDPVCQPRKPTGERVFADPKTDIEVRPAEIDVGMEPVEP